MGHRDKISDFLREEGSINSLLECTCKSRYAHRMENAHLVRRCDGIDLQKQLTISPKHYQLASIGFKHESEKKL